MKSLYSESAVLLAAIVATLLTIFPQPSSGATATWLAAPSSDDWNDAANWSVGGPPNGSSDMAIFATSSQTAISILTGAVEVDKIIFNAGASPFTVSVGSFFNLRITGVGITNNSGTTQNFVATSNGSGENGQVEFSNSATAGTSTVFTNEGGAVAMGIGGSTLFLNTSSADHGTFNNNGAAVGAVRSATFFFDNSTAGNGIFNNNAALFSNADGGTTYFSDSATAGNGAFTNKSATVSGAGAGGTLFGGSSTAGTGTFTNEGAAFSFTSGGGMQFFDTSTAANGTFNNNGGTASGADGGVVIFFDTSNAGMAMFTNKPGTASGALGGFLDFSGDSSTADAAVVVNNGSGLGGAKAGLTQFETTASAGNATLTNNGGTANGAFGGVTRFFDSSTADSATLIANGGTGGAVPSAIRFYDDSTGGTSRIKVFIDGELDISVHNVPGVTIGSIEGNGHVLLGSKELLAGSNNLSTTFSGRVLDGGSGGGTGGSFVKIGTGILSFTNENGYTGGTTITSGTLEAKYDGALGGADVTMPAAGATLTLQDGQTDDYIADTATVDIVSSATVNLNFTGTDTIGVLIIDGVAQPPGLYGTTVANRATHAHSKTRTSGFIGTGQLLAELPVAVSRKVHGGTPYDIYLPVTGSPGIECRSGGGIYKIVVNFIDNATFDSASVTSGSGMVTGTSGANTKTVTIDLSNVTNAQVTKVTLANLNDSLGTRDLVIPLAVLIGDTTGSGDVNSTDVSQTKDESGHLLTTANFRADVTVSGNINSTDVSTVKAHSGSGLSFAALLPQNALQCAALPN